MTLFAVACAGMFPLLHLGRPWLFYWLMPYPNTMGVWPQFRSPLVWDVFAVSHLRHGFAALLVHRPDSRPGHAARPRHASAGARSSTACWRWAGAARPRTGSAIEIGLPAAGRAGHAAGASRCTRVVSFDFAVAHLPGWHTTIFPPYFVAGAIYSGFAMVLTLDHPDPRKCIDLEDLITMRHLDNMAKRDARHRLDRRLRLRDGSLHGLVQRQSVRAVHDAEPRRPGRMGSIFWLLILCNIVIPQLLWSRRVRSTVSRVCSSSRSW